MSAAAPSEAVRLYDTWLRHDRFAPTPHGFTYRLLLLAIDLGAPAPRSWLFGRNRRALLSFRDADHLDGSGRPLEEQVAEMMAEHGLAHDGGRIVLLCQPRLLGHVFNPISTYYVHRRDGSTLDEEGVRTHCRALISNYKVPKTVLFVDEVPRTPVSKVDYPASAALAASLLSRQTQAT